MPRSAGVNLDRFTWRLCQFGMDGLHHLVQGCLRNDGLTDRHIGAFAAALETEGGLDLHPVVEIVGFDMLHQPLDDRLGVAEEAPCPGTDPDDQRSIA